MEAGFCKKEIVGYLEKDLKLISIAIFKKQIMSKPNRLIREKSPYLLQHAYNPVEWYSWCDEAFKKAHDENKPIFLSIGYAACHWCHVMEKESFEDDEVAKLMNETFVSIKVDREERPDIDGVYMTVCQMMTGSGGWPLTIVMTSDKKPFFAGTYFPKLGRYGRAGMMDLIPKLDVAWKTKQDEILKSANEISNLLISSSNFVGEELLSSEILDRAFNELSQRFDSTSGGFGKAPKFPTPHNLTFLLRYWKRNKNDHALFMVEKTLHQMRLGGIYDHVGYGFHRYSTDSVWLVPHFEKMLYDQALLAIAYIEAYQATKNDLYKKTAIEILEYVSRDMTSPEGGGFYSAEDADSEGEEGKYYLWMAEEINEILREDSQMFSYYFNTERKGNWIDSAQREKAGSNILNITKSVSEVCSKYQISKNEFEKKIGSALKKLFDVRRKRIHPFKDDKILTDWNSLMISAFAKAAQVFDESKYVEVAKSSVKFIMNNMVSSKGRLVHRYRDGKAEITGNLDDYTFFIAALLDLYETTFEVECLSRALQFQNALIEYFWDSERGGFFFTSSDNEELLVRQKEIYDGAIPSGNSVALNNLIRLYKFTGNSEFEEKASRMIKTFSEAIKLSPGAHTHFLSGLDFYIGPSREILVVGNNEGQIKQYLKMLRENFIPNKVILCKNMKTANSLSTIAEYSDPYPPEDNATVYICESFSCKLPITSEQDLKSEIEGEYHITNSKKK